MTFNSVVGYLLDEWQRTEDPFLLYPEKFDKFRDERLFGEIEPGDIVVQTWAWIGKFDTIFPYWQVRTIKPAELFHGIMSEKEAKKRFGKAYRREGQNVYTPNPEGGGDYYCHAVPYTAWPTEVHWFHIGPRPPRTNIEKTGLVSRVPSWDEIKAWHENQTGEIQLPNHWSIAEHRPIGAYVQSLKRPLHSGQPICPLLIEKDMVDLLSVLPVKYYEWTRENFKEKRRIILEWLGR